MFYLCFDFSKLWINDIVKCCQMCPITYLYGDDPEVAMATIYCKNNNCKQADCIYPFTGF